MILFNYQKFSFILIFNYKFSFNSNFTKLFSLISDINYLSFNVGLFSPSCVDNYFVFNNELSSTCNNYFVLEFLFGEFYSF